MKFIQLFCAVILCSTISCTDTPTETTSVDSPKVIEKDSPPPVAAVKPQPVAETASSPIETTELAKPTPEEQEAKKKEEAAEKAAAEKKEKEEAAAKERRRKRREKRKKARKEKERLAAEKAKGKPQATFKESEYDFGVIAQGDKIQHDFVFENTGDADLEILNVDVTCGCTVPTFPFLPIAPGEKGTIGVTYNSTGKLGNQKPMITIITNAKPHTYKIYLKGVVDAERAKTED